jgi:hypothetical protein
MIGVSNSSNFDFSKQRGAASSTKMASSMLGGGNETNLA